MMKLKRKVSIIVLALVLTFLLVGVPVLAQTGGPYDLSWSTVDGGGQYSAGGSYWLGGTAGQPDAGSPMTGGAFELTGGFWAYSKGSPTAVTLISFTATPQGSGVLVQWETAIEIDSVGFNLYRARSPSGDWVRLNDVLIPNQTPGSVSGATYTWFDENVEAGTTYHYKLEDVEVGGKRTTHGPVSVRFAGPTAVILHTLGIDRALGDALLAIALATIFGGAVLLRRASLARRRR